MKKVSGLVPAVVLDWAGPMIDHSCLAPVVALQTILARHGLAVSVAEARGGIGLAKKDHLRALLTTYGAGEAADELYPALEWEVFWQLEYHAVSVAGAAVREGYVPDAIATPDEVSAGRSAPLMMDTNALRRGVWPLSSLVKIGDTPSDIAQGINAGAWTLGVALSGDTRGLAVAASAAWEPGQRAVKFAAARVALRAAGANYAVDAVADYPPVLEEIAARIERGQRAAQWWPWFRRDGRSLPPPDRRTASCRLRRDRSQS